MISIIVSENSSFTNSVLAEFYRKTKVLQLRKSIVQTFKNLYFNINKDSKILINNADAIAGDTDDVNFSLLNPLFKKYLNLLKETYNEKGIESYFIDLMSETIHNYLECRVASIVSKDINLCLVDFTDKVELETVEKLLSSFCTIKNANDIKNTFEKLHFLTPFKNFVTSNESVNEELKNAFDGHNDLIYQQSSNLHSKIQDLKQIPYIKILILSDKAEYKLDDSMTNKSEYDLVIKDTDNIDEILIKMVSLFIQKAILHTLSLKHLNYYPVKNNFDKSSISNSFSSVLLRNTKVDDVNSLYKSMPTTIKFKDVQNFISYHDEIVEQLMTQCKSETSKEETNVKGSSYAYDIVDMPDVLP